MWETWGSFCFFYSSSLLLYVSFLESFIASFGCIARLRRGAVVRMVGVDLRKEVLKRGERDVAEGNSNCWQWVWGNEGGMVKGKKGRSD